MPSVANGVGDIVGGPMFYEFDDAAAVLECYREYIADAPEALGCFFGWQIAPDLPIGLEANLELRIAEVDIPGIMTSSGEPIVNEFNVSRSTLPAPRIAL